MKALFSVIACDKFVGSFTVFFAQPTQEPGTWIHFNVSSQDDRGEQVGSLEGLKIL